VNLPTPLARIEGEANLNSISRFDSSKVIDRDPLTNSSLSLGEAIQMDATSGRLGEWLWQNDRNAMMFSIENRSPLLDYQLGSYFKTGYEQKFHAKWNKFELRKSFDAFKALPTQWRIQKQGFRWDRQRFLRQNKPELLEIIRSSTMVDELVDRSNFIENARKRDKYFRSQISQRLVVLAGLEAALGMTL
jgi:asparagine synthase (glutamine-hydrolysing)